MHCHIHFGKVSIQSCFFLSKEGNCFIRVFIQLFDEIARLNPHSEASTSRVKYNSMIRLNKIDNGLNQAHGGKEFTSFLGAGHGKFVQEVFVNLAKYIPTSGS